MLLSMLLARGKVMIASYATLVGCSGALGNPKPSEDRTSRPIAGGVGARVHGGKASQSAKPNHRAAAQDTAGVVKTEAATSADDTSKSAEPTTEPDVVAGLTDSCLVGETLRRGPYPSGSTWRSIDDQALVLQVILPDRGRLVLETTAAGDFSLAMLDRGSALRGTDSTRTPASSSLRVPVAVTFAGTLQTLWKVSLDRSSYLPPGREIGFNDGALYRFWGPLQDGATIRRAGLTHSPALKSYFGELVQVVAALARFARGDATNVGQLELRMRGLITRSSREKPCPARIDHF